jgi:nitrogen fixation protein NifU and related proteins
VESNPGPGRPQGYAPAVHDRMISMAGIVREQLRGHPISFLEEIEIMDRQEAIEFLMDHYENPRNYGPLEDADVSLSGGNPGCADIITMHARFDKNGKLESVKWEGEGCTISSAAASYVTEITQGMTAEEVEKMSFEDLIEQLGRELVMTRPTCATLALGTLKKGVHEFQMHQKAEETENPVVSIDNAKATERR